MLSERITKMDFVFVNTSAEQKVSKKETESADSKDFNSYLKSDTSKPTSTSNETKTDKLKQDNVSPKDETKGETKLDEYKRLLKGSDSKTTTEETNTTDETPVSPEVYNQVMASVKDIMDIIQSTFNVSGQEIETAMKDLGLNKFDLVNGNGLKDLLSKLSPNGDISTLLVNSEFSKAAKEMFGIIDDLKETLKNKFSLSEEEITNVFQTLKENAGTSEQVKPLADLNIKPIQTNENQNVATEDKNAYQTEKTDSSESKNNTGSNNSSNDLTQGFMNKITQALENSSTDDVNPAKIIKQIIDEIKLTVKQDTTKLEMQIYPEQLGKISLQVMSKDGIVTAQIAAQTTAVKEAIEGQLVILKQNMEEQGIKVDSIEVTIASQGFEQNNQDQEEDVSKENFKKSGLHGKIGEIEEEASMEEQKMQDNGSTVSYKA